MPSEQLLPRAASARGGDCAEAGEVVMVRRSAVAPCVTCGLCGGILRDPTTVSECLHSFCRKCIFKRFEDEDVTSCPTCSTHLGCDPLGKLRADHSLLCIRSMVFPVKRREVEEIVGGSRPVAAEPAMPIRTVLHLGNREFSQVEEEEAEKMEKAKTEELLATASSLQKAANCMENLAKLTDRAAHKAELLRCVDGEIVHPVAWEICLAPVQV